MADFEFSKHARFMMLRRGIPEEWVWRVLNTPSRKQRGDDNNMHYSKPIGERAGKMLHIVVNSDVQPNRVVTVFFDRRMGNRK